MTSPSANGSGRASEAPLSARSRSLLEVLDRAFSHLAGADAVIDVQALQRALGLRSEYLARRVLAGFDTDGDGVIRRDEFLEGVRRLVLGAPADRLLFAFRVHDQDGDGTLDRPDLTRMITLALAEDDVRPHGRRVERLVAALLAAVDSNHNGRISFPELEAAVARHPHLLAQMTRDEARWLVPSEDLLARVESARGHVRAAQGSWIEQGWRPLAVLAVWALANVALLAAGMLQKPRGGHSPDFVTQLARATTGPIELDGALVLFPVLRRLVTAVRRTWLGRALPVDDAVDFHRVVGHTLFALCAVHGLGTIAGYARSTRPLLEQLSNERALTGMALLAIFAVMWVFAWQVVRRTRHFELFYFTHLLYFAWFALAVAHAPGFLGWAGAALVALAVEQTMRLRRRARPTKIADLRPLRSGVTRIELGRPAGFTHHAGDYLFLRIPAVARHEWHPFTITSAPESAVLTVHARALGNWTAAVRRLAETRDRAITIAPAADALTAYVDGPYGSPSGHVFESRFAVLVAGGIGVTPFASILESIVLRANGRGERPITLEKAHFFWLNRDRYSFEWFAALLAELERIDGAGVLDLDIWMTGGHAGTTATALELAREVTHAQGDPDVVTGLRSKTNMGSPDWDATLRRIAELHAPARVDVFFCGPPGLGKLVRAGARRAGMTFRDEKF
ncbi:MAG: EF-hand domain-containing protein [Polyangiaceae bacterium]